MARTHIWLPDHLQRRLRAELPASETASAIAAAAIEARLDELAEGRSTCRHERCRCTSCGAVVSVEALGVGPPS